MPKLITQTRLRKALKKVSAPQTGWLDVFVAITGRADGTVLTGIAGVIYVRNILNGQVLAVYNGIVSNRANVQVEVGRRVDQPGLWRIKGEAQNFSTPATGSEIGVHAPQHQFPGGSDIGWWDRKQVLAFSVLVKDADAFIVRVYGGVFNSPGGMVIVDTQDVDLSSHVPASGAIFVNIETDNAGALSVHEGDAFGSPLIGTVADIPVPDAGQTMIAYILLYEGQTELLNDNIRVPMPLGFNASGFLSEVNWGDIGGTLAGQTDLQAALDAKLEDAPSDGNTYGRKDAAWEIVSSSSGSSGTSGHVLMEDDVTFPPVPLTNETGDDWIYDE